MAFPQDDRAWADAAAFLRGRMGPADRLVAPDPFRFAFPRAQRFAQLRQEMPDRFDWIVVHKGELDRIPRGFLHDLAANGAPAFANEVFVVFAREPAEDSAELAGSDHVKAFHVGAQALPAEPAAAIGFAAPITAVRMPASAVPAPVVRANRPPRPAREPAAAPPRPWLGPGSLPGAARERAFQEELDRLVVDYLGDGAGLAVLDVGCGSGRLAPLLTAAASVTGIDTAEDALARARARHASLPAFTFERMDAAQLRFEAASFDAVVMLDLLDLLPAPERALAEASRVLAQGGRLMVTAMNKESLPLRALRRLALPAAAGGLGVQELAGMLRAAGLAPVRMDGILLSLGWATPGATGPLGPLEEDPEFIEAARVLGRRCGPDLALGIAMLARKG